VEYQVEKMNISDAFFFTSLFEAPKLQRPPETFVPFTEQTLLLKEQPKNGLRTSSKAILTWVTFRARGGHIVGYGVDSPLLTVLEEPDRHCRTLFIVNIFAVWRK
jgi:hypothetical protein